MRYIGCKTKLLEVLDKEINNFCGGVKNKKLCDLFAGTGCIGDFFQDRCEITANDNLYFSYILNRGKLLKNKVKFERLGFDPFAYFNEENYENFTNGFCYKFFAPHESGRQYFSDQNAKKIDFIRNKIEEWLNKGLINDIEHDYLLACLLESVSKISNVAGVYAAYLHIWDSRAIKEMELIKEIIESSVDIKKNITNKHKKKLFHNSLF